MSKMPNSIIPQSSCLFTKIGGVLEKYQDELRRNKLSFGAAKILGSIFLYYHSRYHPHFLLEVTCA